MSVKVEAHAKDMIVIKRDNGWACALKVVYSIIDIACRDSEVNGYTVYNDDPEGPKLSRAV